ncbi:hypothetical protein [Intrasporangium chromatireducens]|uniref:hypothetical protein n=1 Tax=Intrasporangium chromatireducens TaxID=1386088 RepID=UPI0005594B65|nr:hypothetical protein [Intrasporangium chromatireducens]
MSRGRHQRSHADLYWAVGALAVFLTYLFLLVAATAPMIRALWFASAHNPLLYAGLLALIVGLPGLLFTVPRVPAPRTVWVSGRSSRRQLSRRRTSHIPTDALGLASFLLAQAPLPPPWSPRGVSATIANITGSPEAVELSRQFGTVSLVVFAVGIGAAVLAQVYRHAPAFRVIALMLAVGTPVLAWAWVTHAVLA